MTLNIKIPVCLAIIIISLCSCKEQSKSLIEHVDVRIGTYQTGTKDEGNTAIGSQLPFGSINPGPQTPNGRHDGYSPDEPIRGFGQLHVNGTGWGKYGQVFISPQVGLQVGEQDHDSPKANEISSPYHYGVTLTRFGIRTEVTPTHHAAIYRFIFPESNESNVLIDVSHHLTQDIATMIGGGFTEGNVELDVPNAKMSGYGEYFGGFGDGKYKVYFTSKFNIQPKNFGTWKNSSISQNSTYVTLSNKDDRIGGYFNFSTKANDTIYMKIAVSLKSIHQAEYWLNSEIKDFDYLKEKNSAINTWSKELSKINIEGASDIDKKIFYTALYRSALMPRNRTNDMKGVDNNIPVWDDHYVVWDTWRTLFPLLVLINPEVVASNINSFIERFEENAVVKDAFIAGNDMIAEQGGNNIDNIIVDAYLKGLEGVDWNAAYELIKEHADGKTGRVGWQGFKGNSVRDPKFFDYKTNGYLLADTLSCSYTMEYAYNDYCAAQMAKGLGKSDDAERYFNRSTNWTYLWNQDATDDGYRGFIVPRDTNGNFIDLDIKHNGGSWHEYYYEGNAWTYSFFTPHDFKKLINLSDGNHSYVQKLQYAFDQGLINPANEPGFLVPFSFIHAARPDLTSKYIHQLLKDYTITMLPGNDDSGAMSSWYIWSRMGIFPNAGQEYYYLFGSNFKKSTITLANGKKIIIESKNASEDNIYVQSCTVNGKTWNKAWINHSDLANGAIIKFKMGATPNSWAQNNVIISR
jgi:predicted alpha-1,2-mannosidase